VSSAFHRPAKFHQRVKARTSFASRHGTADVWRARETTVYSTKRVSDQVAVHTDDDLLSISTISTAKQDGRSTPPCHIIPGWAVARRERAFHLDWPHLHFRCALSPSDHHSNTAHLQALRRPGHVVSQLAARHTSVALLSTTLLFLIFCAACVELLRG
jgi:hypothetical protein